MSKMLSEIMGTENVDDARLGLVKEMLQVVMGLEPETMDRVMTLMRGSIYSASGRGVMFSIIFNRISLFLIFR